jgi:hypothetical protein
VSSAEKDGELCLFTRGVNIRSVARQISKTDKTSMIIDRKKVEEARRLLGTSTIAETVDAALDEVLALAARRRLLERIEREGGIGPDSEELRRLRAP